MMPWLVREMQRGIEGELCGQSCPGFNREGGLRTIARLYSIVQTISKTPWASIGSWVAVAYRNIEIYEE